MLQDGQIWLNRTSVAKIEKNGKPTCKCIFYRKIKQDLKFVELVEDTEGAVANKLNGYRLAKNRSIIFA